MARLRLVDGEVDLAQHLALRGGEEIVLSAQDVGLIARLSAQAGEVVPREVLLTEVLGYREGANTRAVDHAIRRLRLKIEADPGAPAHIESIRGLGYRWRAAPEPESSGLIGRDAALRALEAQQGEPLLTLLGPGGVGKTALARALLRRRPGLFVDLAAAWDAEDVCLGLAAALGLPGSSDTLEDDIAEALRARPAGWIVLDDAERLLEPLRALLPRWLPALPAGASLLLTSRARLDLPPERAVHLSPLPPEHARDLLAARLPEGAQVEPAALDALLAALDGLPLAIELAAAWLDLVPPEALLERLQARLRILSRRGRQGPERHASLEAAMEVSWALLQPAEQQALGRLALFAGAFELAAAEAVLEAEAGPPALALLGRLRDASLVQTAPEHRFRLLETVRTFAAWRHRPDPEAALRHARHFLAEALAGALAPEELRVAARRCLDLDPILGARLIKATHAHDWRHLPARVALARVRRHRAALGEAEPGLAASLAVAEGQWLSRGGSMAEALQVLAQAQALAQRSGDPRVEASAIRSRSLYALYLGELELAEALLPRGLAAAREAGWRVGELNLLYNQSELLLRQDRAQAAYEAVAQALTLAEAHGSASHVADAARQMGMLAFQLGRPEQARALLARAQAAESPAHYGWLLTRLCQGELLAALGELDAARALAAELEEPVKAADATCAAWRAELLGYIAVRAGSLSDARRHFGVALQGYQDQARDPLVARMRVALAALDAQTGEPEAALTRWQGLEREGQLDALAPSERQAWAAWLGLAAPPPPPSPGQEGPNTRAWVATASLRDLKC